MKILTRLAGILVVLIIGIFIAGFTSVATAQVSNVSGPVLWRLLGGAISSFPSSSSVGVASTTPNAKLTVQGTSGSTGLVFNVASSTGTSMFSVASNGAISAPGVLTVGSCVGCSGASAYDWTPTLYSGVGVNATSTPLWLKATSPFSLIASSTYATNASTTLFSNSGSTWLSSLSGAVSAGAGGLLTAGTLSVANGGTGAVTLTGLLSGNGTSAITGGATISNDNWSGTDLSVANGGSGASTLTGLLQGNGTSAITGVTGTIGQFPYYSGTSALTATSSIVVDTNQRVGIASTTPQRTLSVGGAIVASECNLTDGATVTFDLSTCNQGRVVLGGNRTLDFTNETQALGQTIRFVVCQDGTGTRTLTWDTAIRWAGGTAPTLTTTINKCDVIAGFTTGATTTPVILLDKILNF